MPLHALEHGPVDRPAVVFLHGAGVTGWMWRDAMRALPHLHTLAPDLPGLGRNAALGPFEVARAARHVAAFVEARASGGRAHIVGHSLGGAVAARLVADAPHLARSVTLVGVTARPLPFERLLIATTVGLGPLLRSPVVIRAQARALGVPPEDRALFEADGRAMTPDVLRAVLREGARFRVPDRWREAGVPTLALVGTREAAVNVRSALDLVEGRRNARALGVPGGGHAWLAGRTDLLVRTLTAFWEGGEIPGELVDLGAGAPPRRVASGSSGGSP